MFGDPLFHESQVPVQKLGVRIQIEELCPFITHRKSQDIICDFFNGYAFGNALGVGIQSLKDWWTVASVELTTAATVSMFPLVTVYLPHIRNRVWMSSYKQLQ